VAAQKGEMVGMHYHHGEELFRVLYGRLHVRVDDATQVLGAGQVLIVPAGTRHGYVALEDSEIEVYGEIGAGEFMTVHEPDGSSHDEEIFMEGAPWSRTPGESSQYITHAELLARYRASLAHEPLELATDKV
jgi:mannose-6-phosphate isomerase-like protein (cupin superfamily)